MIKATKIRSSVLVPLASLIFILFGIKAYADDGGTLYNSNNNSNLVPPAVTKPKPKPQVGIEYYPVGSVQTIGASVKNGEAKVGFGEIPGKIEIPGVTIKANGEVENTLYQQKFALPGVSAEGKVNASHKCDFKQGTCDIGVGVETKAEWADNYTKINAGQTKTLSESGVRSNQRNIEVEAGKQGKVGMGTFNVKASVGAFGSVSEETTYLNSTGNYSSEKNYENQKAASLFRLDQGAGFNPIDAELQATKVEAKVGGKSSMSGEAGSVKMEMDTIKFDLGGGRSETTAAAEEALAASTSEQERIRSSGPYQRFQQMKEKNDSIYRDDQARQSAVDAAQSVNSLPSTGPNPLDQILSTINANTGPNARTNTNTKISNSVLPTMSAQTSTNDQSRSTVPINTPTPTKTPVRAKPDTSTSSRVCTKLDPKTGCHFGHSEKNHPGGCKKC